MNDALTITTPVLEDARLFWKTDNRGGPKRELRLNMWYPFDPRYWPGEKHSTVALGSGIQMVLLERSYDPEKGHFVHSLVGPKDRISSETCPTKTRRYVGFMLISPGSAMAALMIPASAEEPPSF